MSLTVRERKARLALLGVNLAEVARTLGVVRQHVYQVVDGVRRSSRVEAAVASAAEMSEQEFFGYSDSVAAA